MTTNSMGPRPSGTVPTSSLGPVSLHCLAPRVPPSPCMGGFSTRTNRMTTRRTTSTPATYSHTAAAPPCRVPGETVFGLLVFLRVLWRGPFGQQGFCGHPSPILTCCSSTACSSPFQVPRRHAIPHTRHGGVVRTSDPVLNWDPSVLHYVWSMVWTLLVFLRSVARGAQCECKPDGTTYIRWDSTY